MDLCLYKEIGTRIDGMITPMNVQPTRRDSVPEFKSAVINIEFEIHWKSARPIWSFEALKDIS
jgi:hypothetical protein